jgi:glycosyltransferase involved in cell wall biosynthesis
MAYGVVPICGSVSSIPQYLAQFGVGKACQFNDLPSLSQAVAWYVRNPTVWRQESARGMAVAELFTYENYVKAVQELLGINCQGQEQVELLRVASHHSAASPITV